MAIEMRITTPPARKADETIEKQECIRAEVGLLCWLKLKFCIDENNDDTKPGEPSSFDAVMYGKNVCPSKRTDDAEPNDDESNNPEIHSMRSCSMIELAVCVSCKGTKNNCEMLLDELKPESVRRILVHTYITHE